jgi:hypothetical protein
MNPLRKVLAGALLTCGCACAMAQVGISPNSPVVNSPNGPAPMPNSGPVRLMNESSSTTGTIIRRDLAWSSKIPLDKTYEQFAPEEKAEFHALYVELAPGDEPPFPAAGMRPVFNSIRKGQQIVRARGQLNLVVTVGPDGKALEVADMGGVGGANALEMARFAGSVLLMTKFKPAVCGGNPCKSQFPFILDLRMR